MSRPRPCLRWSCGESAEILPAVIGVIAEEGFDRGDDAQDARSLRGERGHAHILLARQAAPDQEALRDAQERANVIGRFDRRRATVRAAADTARRRRVAVIAA